MKLQTQAIVNGKYVHRLGWERAKKYGAIPRWSLKATNRRKILRIYIEAQIRNLHSKTPFQVDHIIPLYHPKICGLHVHENLQLLPKKENEDKSNTFHPYREVDGRKYYFERVNRSKKQTKIPKKHNRTKKNPTKLAKKRSKTPKKCKKLGKTIAKF